MQTLKHKECDFSFRVEGDGPPVLFIQGVGLHGDGWLPQVEHLSSQYACLSFDNRGMAGSQPLGTDKLTVEIMADDALVLADALGWRDCHVVGHSMGGHIATVLALSAPGRVRSLTLMCTSARGRDMPPISASLLWTSVRSRLGTKRQRRHAFLEMILPRGLRETEDLDEWAERLSLVFGHDLADSPPVLMKQVGAYRAHDARGRLKDLNNIPTLVVGAAEDLLSPPSVGRSLAGAIPGSRYHEIANAGHGVTVTHADQINALLAQHFAAADLVHVVT
jgi:pimeloyl-ACP methyl ester carboxylesterase